MANGWRVHGPPQVCVFSQICANGDELFSLKRGEPFECELSPSRFGELQRWLLATPDWGPAAGGTPENKH